VGQYGPTAQSDITDRQGSHPVKPLWGVPGTYGPGAGLGQDAVMRVRFVGSGDAFR